MIGFVSGYTILVTLFATRINVSSLATTPSVGEHVNADIDLVFRCPFRPQRLTRRESNLGNDGSRAKR
jgi:hypothetical protein